VIVETIGVWVIEPSGDLVTVTGVPVVVVLFLTWCGEQVTELVVVVVVNDGERLLWRCLIV